MTTPRERFEQYHAGWLHRAAVREADAGGRLYVEAEHTYRTCFQRDRDRVVHCTAFRRLDFKTQVFVPHEFDHLRTRLTHTLEVAQIGRGLGRALAINEDLIEAVALAHDLGHSPFGHTGESALAKCMAAHGGFEHNRQSLRVVEYLEHPYVDFRGLNLTAAVRECLQRHETPYDRPEGQGLAVLEGQVVDIADQIAFTGADLDDSLSAGWITPETLNATALWRAAWQRAAKDAPAAEPMQLRIRAGRNVLAMMVDDAVAFSAAGIEKAELKSPDDARNAPHRCVDFSPAMRTQVSELQKFLLVNVYEHPRAAQRAAEARKIVTELFAAYLANPALLPDRYRSRIDRPPERQPAHRVVCDYVAGMTDRFAMNDHRRICKTSVGME